MSSEAERVPMRWRRRLLVLIAIASLVGVAALLWLLPAPTEVSLTTLARLKPGMSEADVAAIFGPPAVDLTGVPPEAVPRPAPGAEFWVNPGSLINVARGGVPPPRAGARLLRYVGRRATVTAEFDADGRLVHCYPVIHEISGPERIRLRLNWW
jgi:hypothetical protein